LIERSVDLIVPREYFLENRLEEAVSSLIVFGLSSSYKSTVLKSLLILFNSIDSLAKKIIGMSIVQCEGVYGY